MDAKSADLVRLVVRTSRLPKETKACYSSTTLDYARLRLQGADFLLPSATRLQLLNDDGGEAENRTVFSGCREFSQPSSAAVDSPPAVASAVPPALVFPPGVEFRVVLTQGMNTATAASGDLIKAALVTPIMDDSKVLVFPGAAVAARIVRIRRMYGAHPQLLLDMKLETVDVAGVPVSLAAVHCSPACRQSMDVPPN